MDHKLIDVWDPYLRVFHWALVTFFFVAYFTELDVLSLHNGAGYIVSALLVFRVCWGFFGPRHARFTDFVKSPNIVLLYMGAIFRGTAKRFIGHNPAGGAMVVVLLITLALVCISGLALYGLEGNAGPMAFLYGRFPGQVEDWVEEIHEFLSNVAVVLIVLHVAGVLWGCFQHKENLVKSMFTGKKRN